MEFSSSAYKKQQHIDHDVLHSTAVDDLLYKENNNNNKIKTESLLYKSVEVVVDRNLMTINTRKKLHNESSDTVREIPRENCISTHLKESERQSILKYLEPSSKVICTGICQLLRGENKIWKDTKIGVICFIFNSLFNEYTLSLLLPMSNVTVLPAKELWTMPVSASFKMERTCDEHLLVFMLESSPRNVCGLHFYDPHEAQVFHRILNTENRSRNSGRVAQWRRQLSSPSSKDDKYGPIEWISEMYDVLTLKDEDKSSKRGFLGSIFTINRKKKSKLKQNISAPLNFRHIQHLELGTLSYEDQDTLSNLAKKRNSIRGCESFVRGPHNKLLAEFRSSVMVAHKQRRTPRVVKKGTLTKATVLKIILFYVFMCRLAYAVVMYTSNDPVEIIGSFEIFSRKEFSSRCALAIEPLSTTNTILPQPSLTVLKNSHSGMGMCEVTTSPYDLPAIPYLTESMYSEYPSESKKHLPNLPSYAAIPIWGIELPLLNSTEAPIHSSPSAPPCDQSSPEQSTIPITSAFPINNHAVDVTSPSTVFAPVPPIAPPPPPPDLLSSASKPPPFSEIVQRIYSVSPFKTNVQKGLLQSPINNGSIFSAIQFQLEKRREYIVTDSDHETESTNSEWTD
ncbi:hypothetical protein DICVIV_00652 [Dictyocaulus viviparus]|uniref:WH1 domain protein n=1 Tax=Dictyocaulus viviparus TaxID=29172 RepID=A0A0D8YAU9_DICVI|nr:hypothetical protein DICVIV_00652 [Dictyocaulus viviparus]